MGLFFSSFKKKRLEGRGTESMESLQKRLDTAHEALQYGRSIAGAQCFYFINGEILH